MGLACIELTFTENEYKHLREITWTEGFSEIEDYLMCVTQKIIRAKIKSISSESSNSDLDEKLKSGPEDKESKAYKEELFFACLDLLSWHDEFRLRIMTVHGKLFGSMIKIYENMVIDQYCVKNGLEETLVETKKSFYGKINPKLISKIIQKLIELYPDFKNEIIESGFVAHKGYWGRN
jgi:hypothetical protein